MMSSTRRRFLATLASAFPAAIVARQAHAAALAHLRADPAVLDALAEAVLPSALGRTGWASAAAAFREWGAGYREGAEINHGYGTSSLRAAGPTPITRWAVQLDAIDARARDIHQRAFRSLTVAQRQDMIRSALQNEAVSDRLPGTADAKHVALALLAHFYAGSAAADLCYEARIGRMTCRPLAASGRKPLPTIKLSER